MAQKDIVTITVTGKLPHYEAQDGIFRVMPGNMLSKSTGGKRLKYRGLRIKSRNQQTKEK